MLDQLKSNRLDEYLQALGLLRSALDAGMEIEIDQESFQYICAIYELYKFNHTDLRALQAEVMDLLVKHQERILSEYELALDANGLGTYTLGHMEGRYDPSGFFLVMGSLEIGALVCANNIVEALGADYPEDAEVFRRYSGMLESIEGGCHTAYWILRHIANRHLEVLKVIFYPLEPVFKSYILHALDEFVGDPGVIDFYKAYIQDLEKISYQLDEEEDRQECEALINEAREYLERVEQ